MSNENTLTIPAGQTASVGRGAEIFAEDDAEFTVAKKSVTVSGTAMNPHGVTGPESVTLTIIDDDAPFFADESISYTFTEGLAGTRFLPEAAYGNGTLTYSLSPAPSNGVTFTPGPPARIAYIDDVRSPWRGELHTDRNGRRRRHRHHDDQHCGPQRRVPQQRRSLRVHRPWDRRRLRSAAGIQEMPWAVISR